LPNWIDPPNSGGWDTIATINLTTGSAFEFTDIPQTYRRIKLVIVGASLSGGGRVTATLSRGSGSSPTYDTGSGDYKTGAEDDTNLPISFNLGSGAATFDCLLQFENYTDTILPHLILFDRSYDTDGKIGSTGTTQWSKHRQKGAIKAIKGAASSGTFDAGTATLYGEKF
jgi:hypothetical protein